MHFVRKNKGFTLLVSSLISSLMLVVGLSIFNITFKELRLTSTSRDSQIAFYAADAGMECALFWDFQHPTFTNSIFATSSSYTGVSLDSSIMCAEVDITDSGDPWLFLDSPNPSADAATTTFTLQLGDSCAIVTVAKFGNPTETKVESRGQTLCDTNSPRRVERALRVKY